MSDIDREKLKSFFRNGALPTAEHYGMMIDSMVNKYDDGFEKDADGGLRVTSVGGKTLFSFSESAGGDVKWRLTNAKGSALSFRSIPAAGAHHHDAAPPPSLHLSSTGPVGICNDNPKFALDVDGPVRSNGRVGAVPKREDDDERTPVEADGEWHSITPILTGCHAFEVMAGVGGEKEAGRYALLHATALNAYNPTRWKPWRLFYGRRIRSQAAVYGGFADRLRLRWLTVGKWSYKLQIKTASNYGTGTTTYPIRYGLTRLWFDPTMEGSRQQDAFEPPQEQR